LQVTGVGNSVVHVGKLSLLSGLGTAQTAEAIAKTMAQETPLIFEKKFFSIR
jgi:hypothetical protein